MRSLYPPPVPLHHLLFGHFARPLSPSPIRFRDVAAHTVLTQLPRHRMTLTSLASHSFFRALRIHPLAAVAIYCFGRLGDPFACLGYRLHHRCRVPFIRSLLRHRDDGTRLQTHRMLGFIGHVR